MILLEGENSAHKLLDKGKDTDGKILEHYEKLHLEIAYYEKLLWKLKLM